MTEPYILLASGERFWLDAHLINSNWVEIEDIALGLSHECRFSGQIPKWYCVAEHSVHCASIAPEGFKLEALLHDAAEAFIKDIATPTKQLLPDYQRLEARVETFLRNRWGLPVNMSPEVKKVDLQMLALEKRDVLKATESWSITDGVELPDVKIQFWDPVTARKKFLETYVKLSDEARMMKETKPAGSFWHRVFGWLENKAREHAL